MNDLTLTIIQSELHWEQIDANLAMFEEKIRQINSTELIILPEMFSTGFTMNKEECSEPMNGKTTKWMKLMAKQSNAVIMGSIIIKENQQYFNRLLVVFPDEKVLHYDKRHLFTLAKENFFYTKGTNKLIFEIHGWKIFPLICYDLRFPVWSRYTKDFNFDLIVFCANWPSPRINAWNLLLQARAIENIAFSVGVNRVGRDEKDNFYSGNSAIYDFCGTQIADLKSKNTILTQTLNKEKLLEFRKKFNFLEDGDSFHITD